MVTSDLCKFGMESRRVDDVIPVGPDLSTPRQTHRRVKSSSGDAADRIALFVPSMHGGGAERVMALLARGFVERGLQVDLVLARAEGPYLDDLPSAVRIVDLGSSRVLTSLPRLVRYLRRERPSVMLSALDHANVLAIVAHRLARVRARLAVSVHATLFVATADKEVVRPRWMPRLMRWTYPLADRVIAVSSGVADDLAATIGLPRERIEVIYNPVVTPELHKARDQAIEHAWLAPGAPPLILGAGRLEPQKDFETLIRAFARLRAQRQAHLMILGEGALRAELTALSQELGVADDVALPGFVDNPFAYMRHAAAFVLSSRFEGLGVALIEAMACGARVVSTDCPSGPAEILEGGRWGRLVAVGDAGALSEAISSTLDDGAPPEVVRRAADFTLERAVRAYVAALGMDKSTSDQRKS